jgi:hypothetical protein
MAGNLTKGGVPFATPVFDGASEEEIRAMLKLAYPEDSRQDQGLDRDAHAGLSASTDAPATPSSGRRRSATCTS